MKILGIIGSPRQFGNCEILVKEIYNNIPGQHELNLLRLTDFNISNCNGCYRCLFGEMKCPTHDDLYKIIDEICESDAIILAIPTYFFKAHSTLHKLMDRGLSFYGAAEKLWSKPAVGIGICGIKDKEGSTLLDIDRFLKVIQAEVKQTIIVNGRLPGDVFLNEKNKTTAKALAKKLFEEENQKREISCPLCGGDTFRFLSAEKIKCMLCSNTGNYRVINKKIEINMTSGGDSIFLSKEDSLSHLEWLREMKSDYIKNRDELKKIKNNYIGTWNWIKP